MVRRLAVIPARGGSRRLPGKNVVPFRGRPIISWTIEAAIQSDRFDKVVVSTEDDRIAKIAMDAGAEVQMRPSALAGDEVRVVDVCRHVVEVEREAGIAYGTLCCLYPTAPLRDAEDVRAVVDLIDPPECEFAIATTTYSYPPHQALRSVSGGGLVPMWPELVDRRADEIPSLCVDNGSTYAADVDAFLKQGSFYGPGLRGHAMAPARSVDIDTGEDLDLALYHAGKLGC